MTEIAGILGKPLYIVGGYVRGMLIDGKASDDVDICSPVTEEEFSDALKKAGIRPDAVYKRTHTVLFKKKKKNYEFTSFRKETYLKGGGHTPIETEYTSDIKEDALRRDFKCNAVYYDVGKGELVDPLGGIEDIKNRVISTADIAEKVFSSDGLRLLRLARFSAELGFTPTEETLRFAKKYAENVKDISPERIYAELKKILCSPEKYPYSDKEGCYHGLKMLFDTGILRNISPCFYDVSVSEKDRVYSSFKTTVFLPENLRLAGAFSAIRTLNFNGEKSHGFYAEKVKDVLTGLKAPRKEITDTYRLILNHTFDDDGTESDEKVMRFLAENVDKKDDFILLKKAREKAGDDGVKKGVYFKWENLYEKMKKTGVPFGLKDLKITGDDILKKGIDGKDVGKVLSAVYDKVFLSPDMNERETLLSLVDKISADLRKGKETE
ncbi:MAG: hypothetical protein MJ072_01335 [Clostridia bacterium]|nr:hypothetical protein [Clostridia bacterium]